MRRTTFIIFMLASLTMWAGSKITRNYVQRPLPEVLVDIDRAAPEVSISFIYNKLEDYTVTCSLHDASPVEAIQQAIGFYPVRVVQSGKTIVVEPIIDAKRKLVGRVVDEGGRPLEFANIALLSPTDSAFICGGVANASGDFVIPCEHERVLLRASYIGYKTAERVCDVGNVGAVVLTEDAIALAEVRKTGTRQLARMERGALVYDMQMLSQIMPADDAYEALTRIPGVSEVNGNMEFAGQTVTLIINGKASTLTAEQVKERLRQMPPERLAKAEVMMSAPARYHVRGAVINIVTKDLYGQHLLAGQVSGVGYASKESYGYGKGSLLYAQGKFSIDANYAYMKGGKYTKTEQHTIQPLATGPVNYDEVNDGKTQFIKHTYHAGMEYAFAPNNRIDLSYDGSWYSSRVHYWAVGTYPSETLGRAHQYVNNVSLNYNSPFGLKLGATHTWFDFPNEQDVGMAQKGDTQGLASESGQTIGKWSFTADQTHALKHEWALSYGSQMLITTNDNWQDTFLPTGEKVDEATSGLSYTERITSFYASASKSCGKALSAEAGVQAENYHTQQWNEWRLYPTMNVLWRVTPQSDLNLSFGSNTTYPRYWSLMSGRHYSSAYMEIVGNPNLKPMHSYVMSLMWRFRQRYTITAVYQHDDDYIAQMPFLPTDRMAVEMQEVNLNFRQQLGFGATAQWKIGTWANGSVGGYCTSFRDKCDDWHDTPFDRQKWMCRIYGTAVIKPLAQQNLTLTLQPLAQTGFIQGIYDVSPLFRLDATLRWSDKRNRLSLSLRGDNITNQHYSTTVNWHNQRYKMQSWNSWRSVQLSLTYRFGDYKDKKRKQVDTTRMGH